MALTKIQCPNCGANLTAEDSEKNFHCQYCNTDFVLETPTKVTNLNFNLHTDEFIVEDGVLLQYTGDKTTVYVPDGVREISEEAFLFTNPFGGLSQKQIVALFLPESVTEMNCSFEESSIKKFVAPGIKRILKHQFSESALEVIICPNLEVVEHGGFFRCYLQEVNFPNLQRIEFYGFHSCKHLKKIEAPKLQSIGEYGFCSCKSLESVNFPNVTEFYDYAFERCESLKKVHMPNAIPKNTEFKKSQKGTYSPVGGMFFAYCDNLTDVVLKIPFDARLKGTVFVRDDGSIEESQKSAGCYVATCVYGSYDCPQVWTLRRYRDNTLAQTWSGRAFIKTYYAISPTLVKWFGNTEWFKKMWQPKLDRMVKRLNNEGVENTPYQDRNW